MEYKIQSIVFPTETKHQQCRDLFYHGYTGYLDREKKRLLLGKKVDVDFTTYLNACSFRKWKKYTNAKSAKLYIDIQGDFSITFVGYSKDLISIDRTEYATYTYALPDRTKICFEYPDNNDQMLGFEISTLSESIIYGGYFTVDCAKEDINNVCLSIATTTCHKEEFIKKNIELIKAEILNNSKEEASQHIYVHVVDNGETLTKNDISGKNIFLHSNHNTGGAGGFARGMIESLHQTEETVTHVLLMDDDVLMLPESILRTYHLLNLLKEEYKDSFVSGAMLYYEEPTRQHEDIGTVTTDCMFFALKPKFDHNMLSCNLENEGEFLKQKNEYAGWWYCCIPTHIIKKNGLPLPIFIRCDDMEYSLRCHANIITMNGICVWHMGFTTKYNAAFDKYQQCRNLLIDKACSNIMQNVDVIGFVKKSYRIELLKFNYNAAELIVKGFEDYLKGPDFIKKDNGEKIVKENMKLNDQLIPIEEIADADILDVFSCYFDPPRKFLDKWLYRITYNGQRFWPTRFCKKDYAYIGFDHSYQPQKMAMHNRLVAVNPFNRTGKLRELDKEKYKRLQTRFKKAWNYYKKHNDELIKKYQSEAPTITSEIFWRKYLGI